MRTRPSSRTRRKGRPSFRGTSFRAFHGWSTGSPPVRSERRISLRMSRRSPRGSGIRRRDIRRGRRGRWRAAGDERARTPRPSSPRSPSRAGARAPTRRARSARRRPRRRHPRVGGKRRLDPVDELRRCFSGGRAARPARAEPGDERAIEELALVVPGDERLPEREVDVLLPRHVDRAQPAHRVTARPGPTSMPTSRSTRPKVTTWRTIAEPGTAR